MQTSGKSNQESGAQREKGKFMPKRNGKNRSYSNSNERTTTTNSVGSPGHKK